MRATDEFHRRHAGLGWKTCGIEESAPVRRKGGTNSCRRISPSCAVRRRWGRAGQGVDPLFATRPRARLKGPRLEFGRFGSGSIADWANTLGNAAATEWGRLENRPRSSVAHRRSGFSLPPRLVDIDLLYAGFERNRLVVVREMPRQPVGQFHPPRYAAPLRFGQINLDLTEVVRVSSFDKL